MSSIRHRLLGRTARNRGQRPTDLRAMRLLFDHGTLVLAEPPDIALAFVPGLLWDDRVALFRAPAFRYADILRTLSARGLPLRDEVAFQGSASTGPWQPIELRPYQLHLREERYHLRFDAPDDTWLAIGPRT